MFNEPNTPDSPQHEDTHTYTHGCMDTHMHMHARTAAVGPEGLRLLATDMETPAAASYRSKHGLSIYPPSHLQLE